MKKPARTGAMKEQVWRTTKSWFKEFSCRRLVDFDGHDLVLNTKIPTDFLPAKNAFEVRNGEHEFIGIVFETLHKSNPDGHRTNVRYDCWHAIDTRMQLISRHSGKRNWQILKLMNADEEYFERLRRQRQTPSFISDMADLSAAKI